MRNVTNLLSLLPDMPALHAPLANGAAVLPAAGAGAVDFAGLLDAAAALPPAGTLENRLATLRDTAAAPTPDAPTASPPAPLRFAPILSDMPLPLPAPAAVSVAAVLPAVPDGKTLPGGKALPEPGALLPPAGDGAALAAAPLSEALAGEALMPVPLPAEHDAWQGDAYAAPRQALPHDQNDAATHPSRPTSPRDDIAAGPALEEVAIAPASAAAPAPDAQRSAPQIAIALAPTASGSAAPLPLSIAASPDTPLTPVTPAATPLLISGGVEAPIEALLPEAPLPEVDGGGTVETLPGGALGKALDKAVRSTFHSLSTAEPVPAPQTVPAATLALSPATGHNAEADRSEAAVPDAEQPGTALDRSVPSAPTLPAGLVALLPVTASAAPPPPPSPEAAPAVLVPAPAVPTRRVAAAPTLAVPDEPAVSGPGLPGSAIHIDADKPAGPLAAPAATATAAAAVLPIDPAAVQSASRSAVAATAAPRPTGGEADAPAATPAPAPAPAPAAVQVAAAASELPPSAALPAAAPDVSAPAAALAAAAAPAPAAAVPDRVAEQRPPAPQLESTIAQVGELREALRSARPAMTVQHAEFGMVSLRLEQAAPDQWRAVLASRDPGFVPAVQAALDARTVAAAADTATNLAGQGGGGSPFGTPQQNASQNGAGDQRYGASPNGGQGSSQPYMGQSGSRDGEAAPDHRRPSTAAALAGRSAEAEDGTGGSPRTPGGLFA